MYPISDALRARFEAGERKSAKVTLNNADVVDLLITEADIVSDTLSIDRYCTTGSKIEVGSAVSAELSLVLNNSNGKFDEVTFEGAELKVEIGINGVADSYIPCGYFTVDEPPRAFSRISLKALDFMMRYDKRADLSLLPFPCNAETLVRAISDICDVEVSEDIDFDSFPNSQETLYAPTSADITYRQILQWVAQITGTCAYIDWNGKLMLSWFVTTDVNITPALRYSGDVLENDIEITGVVVKTQSESYVSGTEEYPLDVDGNELIYNGTEQYKADNILNAVSGFKYRPYECSCMPMPYLYPLDRIAYTDKNGNKISTVITNHTFGLNNVSSIAAQGETKQKKSYALQKSITKKEVNAAIKEALKDFDSSAEHVYVKYSPYNGGKDSEGNVVWNDNSDDTTVYIGICATSEKTAPANPTEYKWSRVRGADGYTPVKDKDYFDGDDGRGVSKVETWYYLSTSETDLVGGSWSTSAPTWTDGTYLWTKLVTTYTDSKTEESAAVVDASWKKTSAVETAAEDLSKTLAGALGLHSTPLTVNGATIWYYHTNPVLTDSKEGDTILVWNGAGVGVCKSGWVANGNLDFTYGATFDGKAVWDILVANNISADNIEAGVIKSIASAAVQTKLNLNDGTMSFETGNTLVTIQGATTDSDGVERNAGLLIQDKSTNNYFGISLGGFAYMTAEYAIAMVKYLLGSGPKPEDPYFSEVKEQSIKTKDIRCQNIYVLNEGIEENLVDALTTVGSRIVYHDEALAALQEKYTALEEALGQQHEHTAATAVKENIVAPTCTNAGSYDSVVYCATCGEEISRQTITTEATGHDYTSVVTPPTETAQGYTTHTCKNCGHSYKDNYTDTVKYFTAKISSSGASGSDEVYISGDANGSTNYGSQKSSSTVGETMYYFAKAGSGRVVSKIVTSTGQTITADELINVSALNSDRTQLAYPMQVVSAFLGSTMEITVYFEDESSGELTIVTGETKSININAGEITYLKFIPSTSGTYEFTSLGTSDDDVVGYLYDANKSQIATDDDTAGSRQFLLTQELTAGTTYYWGVKYYSTSKTGSVNVKLTYKGSGGSSGGDTSETVSVEIYALLGTESQELGSVNVQRNGVDVTNSSTQYSFVIGDTVTLTATPYSGSSFLGWLSNGTWISRVATYTFTVSSDTPTQILAYFNG